MERKFFMILAAVLMMAFAQPVWASGTGSSTGNGAVTSEAQTSVTVLSAPVLKTVKSVAYNKLKITWSKVPGASGYYVYRKSGNTWKKIANTSENSFTHISSSKYPIVTGEFYTYTVRAYRNQATGIKKSTYNKTGISGRAIPDTTTLVSVENDDVNDGIKLTWKKAAGATNYLVYRKDTNGKWSLVANVKGGDTLEYVHRSSESHPIVNGQTYTYMVRSYTSVNRTRGKYDANGKSIKVSLASVELDKKLEKATQEILKQITTSSMTKSRKLEAVWRYVTSGANFSYWPKYPNLSKKGWQKETALDMLTTRKGNCYSFACAFAALASEIGYSPSIICGRVSGSRDAAADGMTRHCWVQISGLFYDPEAQFAGWYRNVYGLPTYDIYHTIQRIVSFN